MVKLSYRKVLNKSFYFLNLVYMLLSSFIWPYMYFPEDHYVAYIGVAIYLLYFVLAGVKLKFDKSDVAIIVTLVVMWLYWYAIGLGGTVYRFIPAVLLCLLSAEIKKELLQYVTKWFSILISLALLLYLVSWVVTIPHFNMITYHNYSPFYNYLLWLKVTYFGDVYRFNAFFFEPGHCATVCILFLIANRYRLKRNKYLIPLLIAVILSFSLAGYVLLIISLILINANKLKRLLVVTLLIASVGVYVTILWNDGDNPVNLLIVERLQYSKAKGIKGNNRAIRSSDYYYKKSVENGDIIFGMGKRYAKMISNNVIGGAGYKLYSMQYGYVGVALIALFYYTLSLKATRRNRWFAIAFLLTLASNFLQRSYPGWFSMLMAFICSISVDLPPETDRNKKRK